MKLTIDTGKKRDLSAYEIALLDKTLRTAIPKLVGWDYSPLTGELTLDFGDVEDNSLLTKIEDWTVKAGGVKKKRLEILEMIKEWVE